MNNQLAITSPLVKVMAGLLIFFFLYGLIPIIVNDVKHGYRLAIQGSEQKVKCEDANNETEVNGVTRVEVTGKWMILTFTDGSQAYAAPRDGFACTVSK